jgi:hypothetical protein
MKYSLNGIVYPLCLPISNFIIHAYLPGLVGNLKTLSPNLFTFYSCLKDRIPQVPLLPEEKSIASSEIGLLSKKLAKLMNAHDACQALLKDAFAWQQEKAAVSGHVLKRSPSFYHCI